MMHGEKNIKLQLEVWLLCLHESLTKTHVVEYTEQLA